MRFGSRGPSESPMWIESPGKRRTGTKQEKSHRTGISPRIRWGSIFLGREWGTGALLITTPFLCKRPRLTYKFRSRVTVICKFFMASLFQTCLLTDDPINQQFYKLMIIKLRGREGKGTLVRNKEWRERRAVFHVFSSNARFLRSVAWRH